MMKAFEVNFDGLVGPSHSYAGLSFGNIASMNHRALVSNPREAALQGLRKAKALVDLGLKQGVLAPQERPDIAALKRLGFSGTDQAILETAAKVAPEILGACASASSMWVANAATIAPSADTNDKRVHFTAANLNEKFHRSIEPPTTSAVLKAIFADSKYFKHHDPLPSSATFGDEGAANHTRFCVDYGSAGVQLFVYGRRALDSVKTAIVPKVFPARQTIEASQAIARLHELSPSKTVFLQQHPDTIDAGAFHNDVVAVGNRQSLFFHEHSFYNSEVGIRELTSTFERECGAQLSLIQVMDEQVPLRDAIKSYLFNSQLITLKPGHDVLVAPRECEEIESVRQYLKELTSRPQSQIREVKYFDLRQSMQNGGGPACLRLRVVLTEAELKAANQNALLTESNYDTLCNWVKKHYRDRLAPSDLADPELLLTNRRALDELTQILNLGSVYPFQRNN